MQEVFGFQGLKFRVNFNQPETTKLKTLKPFYDLDAKNRLWVGA
jgi:hypothetical protein